MSFESLASVIVPCYNQAQYLPEALQSILEQTITNWECIIVNDGSTDNTEEIALEWGSKDGRFKYFNKENGGLSSARNAGLKIAKGKYIQFLDADDVIDKNKFSLQIDQLKGASDYAISYTDYFASSENNLSEPCQSRYLTPRFKSDSYLLELINDWESKLSIPCHCFLFTSKIFIKNNIFFDETLPNHEDWECWMNIFALKPQVLYIDKKLSTYRIHPRAMCNDNTQMKIGFQKAILKQKKKYRINSKEFKLLSIKYNQLRYGISSRYSLIALLVGLYKKVIKNVKRLIS